MKKILLSMLCAIIFSFTAFTNLNAQITFLNTYGFPESDDLAMSIVQTYDNGYLLAGFHDKMFSIEVGLYLVRTNAMGDTLWTRADEISELGYNYCSGGIQTSDSGFILMVDTFIYQPIVADVSKLAKFDKNGNWKWSTPYVDYGEGIGVKELADGSFITGFDGGLLINKYSPSGELIWSKEYDTIGITNKLIVLDNNEIVVTGATFDNQLMLAKFDTSGNMIWEKHFSDLNSDFGPGSEYGNDVASTSDHGFIIVGNEYNTLDSILADGIILTKTDSLGNEEWYKLYNGEPSCFCAQGRFCTQLSDGSYFIAGGAGSSPYNQDIFVIRTDTLGNVMNTVFYGTLNAEQALSAVQVSDGIAITGRWNYYEGNNFIEGDMFLLKTNFIGEVASMNGIDEISGSGDVKLLPNPFTTSTTIQFNLTTASQTSLQTFDVNGSEIKTLLENKTLNAGTHSVTFDADHNPAGIYYYVLRCNEKVEVGKMVLVK